MAGDDKSSVDEKRTAFKALIREAISEHEKAKEEEKNKTRTDGDDGNKKTGLGSILDGLFS